MAVLVMVTIAVSLVPVSFTFPVPVSTASVTPLTVGVSCLSFVSSFGIRKILYQQGVSKARLVA